MSMRHFHCDVFSFDPTMDWKDGRKRGKRITFRKIALASKNADNQSLETDLFSHGLTYKSASPVWNWRTLRGTAETLGHQVRLSHHQVAPISFFFLFNFKYFFY